MCWCATDLQTVSSTSCEKIGNSTCSSSTPDCLRYDVSGCTQLCRRSTPQDVDVVCWSSVTAVVEVVTDSEWHHQPAALVSDIASHVTHKHTYTYLRCIDDSCCTEHDRRMETCVLTNWTTTWYVELCVRLLWRYRLTIFIGAGTV